MSSPDKHYYKKRMEELEKQLREMKESLSDQATGEPAKERSPKTPPRPRTPPRPKTPDSYDRVPKRSDETPPNKVRGKKRKNLEGHTCDQCDSCVKALGLSPKSVQRVTRHRGVKPPATPPGFWEVGWVSPKKTPPPFIPEKVRERKSLKDLDFKTQ